MGSFLKLSYRLGPGILSKIAFASYKGRSDPTPMIAPIMFGMFKFIPIIGYVVGIEVGSNFFFPSLTWRLSIKKIYLTAQAFQTPSTYLCPIKNPKPCRHSRVETMLQKMVLQKRCWSNAVEDDVTKAVLKRCYRRRCCKSSVEAVLQKTLLKWCCRRRCWSGVAENVAPKNN